MPIRIDYMRSKVFQGFLFRQVSDIPGSRRFVDDTNGSTLFSEFFSDAFPDAVRSAGYDGNFPLKQLLQYSSVSSSSPRP